jgi:hypothetical protein
MSGARRDAAVRSRPYLMISFALIGFVLYSIANGRYEEI